MKRDYTLKEGELLGLPLLEVYYPIKGDLLEMETVPFQSIIIHHMGARDYSIQDLIDLHMGKLSMGAIGYHFLIDSEGKLYYTRSLDKKGAHAFPNTGKIGIGLLRSFDDKEPNSHEVEALKRITRTLRNQIGRIDILGHNQDIISQLIERHPSIVSHRDTLIRLCVPESIKDFNKAKEKLLQLEGIPKDYILKLKTCPGVLAYKGAIQNVVRS